MPVLKIGDSVIGLSDGLFEEGQLLVSGRGRKLQGLLSLVEDVQDIMKTRDRIEVNAVGHELLAREAWKEMEVRRMHGAQSS